LVLEILKSLIVKHSLSFCKLFLKHVYRFENIFLFLENNILNPELTDWTVPKYTENVAPINSTDQQVFNYEPNHLNQNLHSKIIKNFDIKFSFITILHIILSQIVLVIIYYDLGFLFGNVSYMLLN